MSRNYGKVWTHKSKLLIKYILYKIHMVNAQDVAP